MDVQALCNEVFQENPPRRMVTGGLDFRRFDQVLAVLVKIGRVKLYNQDVRANVLGGAPAAETAVDAAMAAAVLSSFYELDLAPDVAYVGEVDLGGVLLTTTLNITYLLYSCVRSKRTRLSVMCAFIWTEDKLWNTYAGDLRKVRALEKRVSTAVAQGFSTVVVPVGTATQLPAALAKHVKEVANIKQLKKLLTAPSASAAARK